jgi:hypothetical protein
MIFVANFDLVELRHAVITQNWQKSTTAFGQMALDFFTYYSSV